MGGIDDLIDDVDKQKQKEDAKGILDEIDVDSKEELEQLEDRLDSLQKGLLHYDKRMEKLEDEVAVLRSIVVEAIMDDNNEHSDNTVRSGEVQDSERGTKDDTDGNSGLDW